MPHFVVEYTDNVPDPRIPILLTTVNQLLLDQDGVYPPAGIRSRAVRLTEYAVADQAADYAFVHAKLTIGSGRSAAVIKQTGDRIFAAMRSHFDPAIRRGYLALSLEMSEFNETLTWKDNNIHARFGKR
jgi:5-carboxymethyl-2-hydroxymuconate isomerase